jgi:hypothetical protein
MGECLYVSVSEGYFSIIFEVSVHQSHVITHLFLNENSLYNCRFYTHVACCVEHNT